MTADQRASQLRGTRIRVATLRKVRLGECRDCGVPIRFVRLPTGRLIPINPQENTGGSVAASLSGDHLVGFVISKDNQPGPMTPYRFMPHAATCSERKPAPAPKPEDPALW